MNFLLLASTFEMFFLPYFGGRHLPRGQAVPLPFQHVHLDMHQTKLSLHTHSVQ